MTSFITSSAHKKKSLSKNFSLMTFISKNINYTYESWGIKGKMLLWSFSRTHKNDAQRNHSKVVAFRLINELVSAFNYHNVIYSFHVILTLTHIMPYKRVHHSCLQLTSTMTNDIHYMKRERDGGNEQKWVCSNGIKCACRKVVRKNALQATIYQRDWMCEGEVENEEN